MSGGRPWTTSEARRLHELREQGFRTADIARLLNRSYDAINSFLRYVPSQPKHLKKSIVRVPPRRKGSPSEELRVATLIAIAAYANREGLHIDDAARRLLVEGRA